MIHLKALNDVNGDLSEAANTTVKRTTRRRTYSSILSHLTHAHTQTRAAAVVLPETPYVFPYTERMRGRRGPFFHGKPFKRASMSV